MSRPLPKLMVAATAVLAAVSIGVAVAAQPLLEITEDASEALLSPELYVEEVLGP